MQEKRNIDDLLNQVDLTPDSLQETSPAPETINNDEPKDVTKQEEESSPVYGDDNSTSDKGESEEVTTTDEYGQAASKKEKLYTQAEVEQMMRDRNKRGEFAKQETYTPPPETHQSSSDESGGEEWEQQFEALVDQTISKREQKRQEAEWQQRMQHEQAEFEIKFNSGAAKYADFESVVVGKPLTPSMVIATKAMKDPAAFIYAAAKTQAHELERISKIEDKLVQAVEIGKLEERMRKGKASSTGAPRPIESAKGDVVQDKVKPRNIDDILREEAYQNSRRGR